MTLTKSPNPLSRNPETTDWPFTQRRITQCESVSRRYLGVRVGGSDCENSLIDGLVLGHRHAEGFSVEVGRLLVSPHVDGDTGLASAWTGTLVRCYHRELQQQTRPVVSLLSSGLFTARRNLLIS